MVTTFSITRFAVLQDVGIILSGIERNNHIICGFLSLNYPWDKKYKHMLCSCFTGIITRFIWSFIIISYSMTTFIRDRKIRIINTIAKAVLHC